jgi:hypothetical protein
MPSPYTEEFTLLAVGLAVILIRVSSRIGSVGFLNLFFDDYLMLLAAVSQCILIGWTKQPDIYVYWQGIYIAETSLAWSVDGVFHGMANNGLTADQRASVVTGSEEYWLR